MRPSNGAKNITRAQKILTGLTMSLRFERLISVTMSTINHRNNRTKKVEVSADETLSSIVHCLHLLTPFLCHVRWCRLWCYHADRLRQQGCFYLAYPPQIFPIN